MVWGNAAGSGSEHTVVQTWGSPNASTLAVNGRKGHADNGTYSVETAPSRFYLSSGRSTPTSVTGAWCDLWQYTNASARSTHHKYLLGGEIAMWTDSYCYINDCVRPNEKQKPPARGLWNRSRDDQFGESIGGMLWPRGHLAAGAFWHFQPSSSVSIATVRERVLIQHNAMLAGRGKPSIAGQQSPGCL